MITRQIWITSIAILTFCSSRIQFRKLKATYDHVNLNILNNEEEGLLNRHVFINIISNLVVGQFGPSQGSCGRSALMLAALGCRHPDPATRRGGEAISC